jgi:uncharacterized protein involved in exopolysaccharide biosynthesis
MSIIQFLRIFWARRLVIAAAAICSVIGAFIVVMLLPPRWEGHARIMLNLLKPDPVTGEMYVGRTSLAYVATQVELIRDYGVAGRVVDQLGWQNDANLVAAYAKRSAHDDRDFRRWIAQRVIDRTKASLVEGSNILEITYTATTPSDAKAVVEALRQAYLETNLELRKEDATRTADWYSEQADKARLNLVNAQTAVTDYERDNGIVMSDDKVDIESARLTALASQAATVSTPVVVGGVSPASGQLADVDAMIAQESKTLGPNHPELQQLRAKRASLQAQIAQENAAARSGASAGGGVAAVNRAVDAQKAKVIAQRDKLVKLKQLQDEVGLLQDQFNKTAGRAQELRQQAAVVDTGMSPLGNPVTPQSPAFPNKPLIFGGSLGLGVGAGVVVALLLELFSRRVRGIEDLKMIVDAPVLAVIGPPGNKRRPVFAALSPSGPRLLGRRNMVQQA